MGTFGRKGPEAFLLPLYHHFNTGSCPGHVLETSKHFLIFISSELNTFYRYIFLKSQIVPQG
jgi:hypothetical protein